MVAAIQLNILSSETGFHEIPQSLSLDMDRSIAIGTNPFRDKMRLASLTSVPKHIRWSGSKLNISGTSGDMDSSLAGLFVKLITVICFCFVLFSLPLRFLSLWP